MNIWALMRPVFYMLIGLGLVFFAVTDHPAAESKLKMVEGVASQVEISSSKRHKTVKFHVGDMRTDYKDDSPHYSDVFAALNSGQPVKVWVDNEGLKDQYGHLYKMSVGDKELVSYADTVESKKNSGSFSLWVGLALMAVSGFLFWRRMR